jgi:hypothetical protein
MHLFDAEDGAAPFKKIGANVREKQKKFSQTMNI